MPPSFLWAVPTATHTYQPASRVSTKVTPSRTLGPPHAEAAVERLPSHPHPVHHLGEAGRDRLDVQAVRGEARWMAL